MILSIALFAIPLFAILFLLVKQIAKARKAGIDIEEKLESSSRDINSNYLKPIKRNVYHFFGVLQNLLNKHVVKTGSAILALVWGYLYKKTKKARVYIKHSHDPKQDVEKSSAFLGELEDYKEKVDKNKVDN